MNKTRRTPQTSRFDTTRFSQMSRGTHDSHSFPSPPEEQQGDEQMEGQQYDEEPVEDTPAETNPEEENIAEEGEAQESAP